MISTTVGTQTMQDEHSDYAIELGVLGRSDGSSRFTSRDTHAIVLASANGPLAVSLRDEQLGAASFEVRVQPLRGVGSVKDRDLERIVSDTLRPALLLQLHPRTLLQLTAQIAGDRSALTDSRGQHASTQPRDARRIRYETMAAVINASTVALADSGFPMRGLVAAAAFRMDGGMQDASDDNDGEEARETDYLVAYTYPEHKLVTFDCSGKVDAARLPETIAHGKALCDGVYAVMQAALRSKIDHVDGWRSDAS